MGAAGDSAEVVSLAGRASYRPGYKRLASARVQAARERLGMDHAEFAAYLGALVGWAVTPQTAERWERGSTPPGDVVLACAAITGDAAGALAGAEQDAALPGEAGAILLYPGRGIISRQQWNDIIRGSREHLWLYGMAEFGYATDDETPGILAEAAEAGCEVRVLLLDPAWPGADAIDADEGSPEGTLVSRIRASLARFAQMRAEAGPRVGVRVHATHPTVSIVRGDGEMLVTPYLRFTLGGNSPTLGLTAESAPVIFARYERHFESMWSNSRERD